jgi:hypothetical protein
MDIPVSAGGVIEWRIAAAERTEAESRQPHRIHHSHGVAARIAVGVFVARQADGVGLDVAAGRRVIVAVLVVVEIGERLLLARVSITRWSKPL